MSSVPDKKMLLLDHALVRILCKNLNQELLAILLDKTAAPTNAETAKKPGYLMSVLKRRRVLQSEAQQDYSVLYKEVMLLFMGLVSQLQAQNALVTVNNLQSFVKLHSSDPVTNLLHKPILRVARFVASNVIFCIDNHNMQRDQFELADEMRLIEFIESRVILANWPRCKLLLLSHENGVLHRGLLLLQHHAQVDERRRPQAAVPGCRRPHR
jgi:hypothetical protein